MNSLDTSVNRVLVITDSTASIPPESAASSAIGIVNLHVIVDGVSYEESVDISHGKCVELTQAGAGLVTSQPTIQAFLESYEQAFTQGFTDIVVAVISSALSGTYSTALQAAADASGRVQVIESKTTGMALGLSVLRGARLAAQGAAARDVQSEVEACLGRSGAFFVVDSLDYLRRGGRLSAAAAAVGTVLGLKPVLGIQSDGTIGVVAKVRSRKSAVSFLIEKAREAVDAGASELCVHSFGAQNRGEDLAEVLRTEFELSEFKISVQHSPASVALGAHVGPGMIALTFV